MRINVISNNNSVGKNNNQSLNFRGVDHFVHIKKIPNMVCACCGKEVLSVDQFIAVQNPLAKPLEYVLKRGKLNYIQKHFPKVMESLNKLAKKFPENNLDEIVIDDENYTSVKVAISDVITEHANEKNVPDHYIARRIGATFFDLLLNSRTYLKDAETVINGFMPLKKFLTGPQREAFEYFEQYAKIFPDLSLSEIVGKVHVFHDSKNLDKQDEIWTNINQRFKNIEELIAEKNPDLLLDFNQLKKKILYMFKSEPDPAFRTYKAKQMYQEELIAKNLEDIMPEVLAEVENIPVSLNSVHTFFSYAHRKEFSDGKIISTIFDPIIATEEHVVALSNDGIDKVENKSVLCKGCNTLRGVKPYSEFIKYHPELKENYQKQMDLIINNAISGDLPQNLRFYPIKMVQNLKEATGGLVNLDIVDYAKKEIEASKDRHSQYKDKLIVLDDIRDDKISEIVKNPKLKGNLSEEIEAINSEMEELRDAIWSERNLQSRLNQYLNEKNKE